MCRRRFCGALSPDARDGQGRGHGKALSIELDPPNSADRTTPNTPAIHRCWTFRFSLMRPAKPSRLGIFSATVASMSILLLGRYTGVARAPVDSA
jgi:hypothetical protein